MRESRWITALRHAVLLAFVAIAVYPALNVMSISLRPGNQLRSTDLSIIPADWTFDSYIAVVHRAAVSAVARQLAAGGGGGDRDRRGAGVDRRLRLQPVPLRRPQGDDARDPHDANVPRHDAAVAALHPASPSCS